MPLQRYTSIGHFLALRNRIITRKLHGRKPWSRDGSCGRCIHDSLRTNDVCRDLLRWSSLGAALCWQPSPFTNKQTPLFRLHLYRKTASVRMSI